MKRTFVAVKIHPSDPLLEAYQQIRKDLMDEKIRWVDPGHFHVTLVFLGSTHPDLEKDIGCWMEDIAKDIQPFLLRVCETGVFPDTRRPRVLWIGLEDPEGNLASIKNQMDNRLASGGVPVEKRDFHPHLTVGRVKFLRNRERLDEIVEREQGHLYQESLVESLLYFESILGSGRPEYRIIKSVHLGS